MNKRLVTIFGGAGFIGRYLVRELAQRGWRVRIISRTPSLCGHMQPLGDPGQIIAQAVDTKDEATLTGLLSGSDAVVNLIGILHETSHATFDDIHGALPGRIAKVAAAAGVKRLVHVSAIGANADSPSAYARSKAAGETAVRQAFQQAVIIRPSIVIGPEDDFFNRFAAMARISPALPLIGGGKTRFQPIYVGDVAKAITAGLEQEQALGRSFDVGGPKVYTFENLLRYLLAVIGRKRFLADLSFSLAAMPARLFELLPSPPLTRDQIELLKICLLYTSPSPRDKRQSRMPSSA